MIMPLALSCHIPASVVNQVVGKFHNFFCQELSKPCLATGFKSAAEILASAYCLDLEEPVPVLSKQKILFSQEKFKNGSIKGCIPVVVTQAALICYNAGKLIVRLSSDRPCAVGEN